MKVLHLATQDMAGGGGGFSGAYRLHQNMRTAGIDSYMIVASKESRDEAVFEMPGEKSISGRLRAHWHSILERYLRWRYRPYNYFIDINIERVSAESLLEVIKFHPDVIIAHWVSNFITAATLHDLNRLTQAPVLWYFMDMAPLTGGCHYAFDCSGYVNACGNCPQLQRGRGGCDLSHRQWVSKRKNLQGTDITAVVASSWQQKQLEVSKLFLDKRQEKILLAVDPFIFCPAPQGFARQKLELPVHRKIIFFGANKLNDARKGIRYLQSALKKLYAMLAENISLRDQILVVIAGEPTGKPGLDIPFEHKNIGFLKGDESLALAYQAADVFVSASIEDSGPMMINESILCGTPVVSFAMGVAMDLVHNGQTGYRANLKDELGMADGLRTILELDEDSQKKMRAQCRDFGLSRCHPDVQVHAFVKLCGELIETGRRKVI